MSLSGLAGLPVSRPNPSPARDQRFSILQLQLVPDWRSTEWDPSTETFTLDPEHPRSAVRRCRVKNCEKTARSRHGLCAICRRSFEASGESDREAWTLSAVRTAPQRVTIFGGDEVCLVEHEGVKCARPATTSKLCPPHRRAQFNAFRRGVALESWLPTARPYDPNPACSVIACSLQSEVRALCRIHFARVQADEPTDFQAWLRMQEPAGDGTVVWLGALHELVLMEILFIMQQRDADGTMLDPEPVRVVARLARAEGVESLLDLSGTLRHSSLLWWKRAVDALTVAYTDPADHFASDVWDLRVMGLISGREKGTNAVPLSFSPIRQQWLRDSVKLWISTGVINRSDGLRMVVAAAALLSDAIALGPGHEDRTKLSHREIVRAVSLLQALPVSDQHKSRILGRLEQFLGHARKEGWLDQIPYSFAVADTDRSNFPRAKKTEEEKAGDAVPEHIIQQLNANIALLTGTESRGRIDKALGTRLRQLFYVLLRDTGRRVSDLASLRCGCAVKDGDGWTLIYDNVKSRRMGRRLPIDEETALAIRGAEKALVAAFPQTPKNLIRLFPRPTGNQDGTKAVDTGGLSSWIASWVASIPSLVNDYPSNDGTVGQIDRTIIHPHAFRHSYAQRHADAGTARETLQELMDHSSSETTSSYYQVTAAARRAAVEVVSAYRADRLGNPVGKSSPLGYERQSIAAPYGNCQEPSNVAAGGQACPIRFQCAGCSHYRPDPSYFPAIETHIHELLQNREEAIASEAADWVVSGLESEVAAYRDIASKMKTDMSSLTDTEREAVEEASVILRRARVMDGIDQLPRRAGPVPVTIGMRPPSGATD